MLIEHFELAPRIYTNFKFGQRQKSSIHGDLIRAGQKTIGDCWIFEAGSALYYCDYTEALAFEQLEAYSKKRIETDLKSGNW
jgi:hypothetical protein